MDKKHRNQHFRELPSIWFSEERLADDFHQFVSMEVLPRIPLRGYKLRQKHELATQIIYQLLVSGMKFACVSDTRDTHEPGVELRVQVWDAVVEAGFAKVSLGSESAGRVTRYRATSKLLALKKKWEIHELLNLHLARNSALLDPTPYALVFVHSGKSDPATGTPLLDCEQKQPLSIREQISHIAQLPSVRAGLEGLGRFVFTERSITKYIRRVEDQLERINRSNSKHGWQAFYMSPHTGKQRVQPINVNLRQIHVGRLFRGGRLYSWSELSGQNLSKEARKTILIDGDPAAELDFANMHIRMLYHLVGMDPEGDLYRPEQIMPKYHHLNASDAKRQILRDFVKQATNVCLNVSSRGRANSSVGKLLNESEHSKFLYGVFDLERLTVKRVVTRIAKAHPAVASLFFCEAGMDLMNTEGDIMFRILLTFAENEKPALGIHDSVVCKTSDVGFARYAMLHAYNQHCGFDPVIKRAF